MLAALRSGLVAITSADGNPLASLCATPRQHRSTAFGLHAGAEAVRLGTVAAVRLKCALRHGTLLLIFFVSGFAALRAVPLRRTLRARNRIPSAAQLLTIRHFAASFEYIVLLTSVAKIAAGMSFSPCSVQFLYPRNFLPEQRSPGLPTVLLSATFTKDFSTPCGCRNNTTEAPDA